MDASVTLVAPKDASPLVVLFAVSSNAVDVKQTETPTLLPILPGTLDAHSPKLSLLPPLMGDSLSR